MISKPRVLIVYVLLISALFFVYFHQTVAVPVAKPLEEIPGSFGAWHMISQEYFDDRVLAVLQPTDYISRIYANDKGGTVSFYLGYHAGGADSGPIHSPKHCLPGSGWQEISSQVMTIAGPSMDIPVVAAIYQMGDRHELFLYFFKVRGALLTNEYRLKIYEVVNSIFFNRRESAFIRISTSYEGDKMSAMTAARDFLQDVYPWIDQVLPK